MYILEIDVCNELRPCQHNSTCVQFDKGFECICPEGLLGKRCEINFDECVSSPCFNGGTCIDDIGNFTCLCSDGWTGHQCEINKDDCASSKYIFVIKLNKVQTELFIILHSV